MARDEGGVMRAGYNSLAVQARAAKAISIHEYRKSHELLVHSMINQNYNKILECDWLSVAMIIAFIGQFTRHAWCYWTVYASFARAVI